MVKKCSPGVVCIENVTFLFIVLSLFLAYVTYTKTYQITYSGMYPNPSFSLSNVPKDVLLNPYEPPLKDDRVYRNDAQFPASISTNAVDSDYRQVGILTRMGKETILPLIGKPLYVSRDKWNFYTMKDSNAMIKLPITYKGKSCTNEYGCDNLYNGDVVYVEGYNDTFKVTMYDNQVSRYIPYL